jgi:hypothetical protein
MPQANSVICMLRIYKISPPPFFVCFNQRQIFIWKTCMRQTMLLVNANLHVFAHITYLAALCYKLKRPELAAALCFYAADKILFRFQKCNNFTHQTISQSTPSGTITSIFQFNITNMYIHSHFREQNKPISVV